MSTLTAKQIQAETTRRTELALQHIEAAQGLMASACAELSTLEGAIPMWEKASKMHDDIKAFWYCVNRSRGQYHLDEMHRISLAQRIADAQATNAAKLKEPSKPSSTPVASCPQDHGGTLYVSEEHPSLFKCDRCLRYYRNGGKEGFIQVDIGIFRKARERLQAQLADTEGRQSRRSSSSRSCCLWPAAQRSHRMRSAPVPLT